MNVLPVPDPSLLNPLSASTVSVVVSVASFARENPAKKVTVEVMLCGTDR
jgi:hypothetical protein